MAKSIYKKVVCTHCKGKGSVDRRTVNSNISYSNRCPTCNGTGIEIKPKPKRP